MDEDKWKIICSYKSEHLLLHKDDKNLLNEINIRLEYLIPENSIDIKKIFENDIQILETTIINKFTGSYNKVLANDFSLVLSEFASKSACL